MRLVLTTIVALWAASLALPASTSAGTLDDVKKRGHVVCGIHPSKAGFSSTDSQGRVVGFDVDFCRAVAAALGVDVKFTSLTPRQRFTALLAGEADMLIMTTTLTMNRDTKVGADWAAITYYGGAMLMARKSTGARSIKDLDGATICLSSGTTAELKIADFFRTNRMTYKSVLFERIDDGYRAYVEGRCDAFCQDDAALATLRSTAKNPGEHVILPEVLSKEPVGPVTRQNDSQWTDAVRWVVNALVIAEELGVTQATVEEVAKTSKDPEVQRLLGVTGSFGPDAGMPQDWAVRAIKAVGNYGEIFDRNLGRNSPFKMERGLNALWSKGGLIYAAPIQ